MTSLPINLRAAIALLGIALPLTKGVVSNPIMESLLPPRVLLTVSSLI